MRPADIDPDAWEPVWERFKAQVGDTWGDYVAMLQANAAYLGTLGERIFDVRELMAFEVLQTSGLADPKVLSSKEDAYCSGPGFDLSFTRFFRASMTYRNRLGSFGRGWSHTYDVTLRERTGGSVIINGPDGFDRIFTYNNGQYAPLAGDYGTLSKEPDGTFVLTEKEGIIYQFNASGKLGFVKDRNNNQLTLSYTADLLTEIQHSSGDAFSLQYDNDGRINRLIDHVGQITEYQYDATGEHLVKVTAPGNRTTTYAYETAGDILTNHALKSITYPDGTGVAYSYDPLGRMIHRQASDGTEDVTYTYGSTGRVEIADALGAVSTIAYDENGFPVRMELPSGAEVTLDADPAVGLTKVTSPTGDTASFDYDAAGNLTRITDPLDYDTTFTYHSASDLLSSVKDPRGNSTHFDYDEARNFISMTYEDGSQETFTHYDNGLVSSFTNRRGDRIEYIYNTRGQILRKDYYSGTAWVKEAVYEYDNRGNLIAASNEHGEITFAYDSRNFLTQVTDPSGRYLAFDYNNAGMRTRMVDQDGYVLDYAYDTAGRLAGITDGAGKTIVAYEYDANGSLKNKTVENGVYTTYEYDKDGQLTHLVNYKPNGQVLSRFDYTYDVNGRRTSMTTLDGTYQYQYDTNGQLTGVTYPNGNNVTYTYDPAGNRMSVVDDSIPEAYTTNNMNQYTAADDATYTYDENGNLRSKTKNGQTTIYEYNQENRLIAVTSPEGTWRYTYDALGNRIATEHDGKTTHYLLDPTGLVNVVGEYDAYGNRTASYVHGLGLTARIDGEGNPAYYTFDGNGNTSELTGMDSGVLNSYKYSPFGKSLGKTEAIDNPFEYVGQFGVTDEGNGLQFMRARFYQAKIGRFLQPDPIGFAGGDVNLYRYVKNSPIDTSDPLGLQGIDLIQTILTDIIPFVANPGNKSDAERTASLIGGLTWGGMGFLIGVAAVSVLAAPLAIPAGAVGIVGVAVGLTCGGVGTMIGSELGPKMAKNFAPELFLVEEYRVTPAFSADPNDKLISIGYSTLHHILDSDTAEYTIRFENKADATAAAQLVTVTDPLSSDLDWATFELGDMEFSNHRIEVPEGLNYYKTSINLWPEGNNLLVEIEGAIDPATGIATWTFTAIDPDTGELTEDPLAGFLPPNGENHEGEGFVKFRISPKAGLATGTRIDNMATIVFDWNPPIDTPPVFNTIDAGAPASHVVALPTQSREQFEVSWTGQDDTDGSGIASYDIYVSENGGPYQLWLDDTTVTSAMFEGVGEYRFYSIATDHVGHQEEAPATPDGVTTATENNPPSIPIPASPDHLGTVSTVTPALSVNNSTDPDGDPLTYDFEIYIKNTKRLPPPWPSASGIAEGETTTAWTCDTILEEDTWYAWRVRAFDGIAYSAWTEGTLFFVNQENAPPSVPGINAPLDQAEVDTLQPTLVIENSTDPEGAWLTYQFEVYDDDTMTSLSLIVSGTASETDNVTSWMVPEALTANTWYYWRVQAKDTHDAVSAWTELASFFAKDDGIDDPPYITLVEPSTHVETTGDPVMITWEDMDPDSNATIALYYDTDASGADGTLIVEGLAEDPDGQSDSYAWDISGMTKGTYYVYATITDATSSYTAYAPGSIAITTPTTEVTLDLPSDWSMVSLPIDATDKRLKAIFPNAVVVYRYEKGTGYVRVLNNEELEVGKGYWILLDQATSYTITGQPIESYTRPASEKEWAMIGGCTDPAKVFPDSCSVGVIYRYVQGTGYQRVPASQPLEAGEGYWILMTNAAEGATITVETVD